MISASNELNQYLVDTYFMFHVKHFVIVTYMIQYNVSRETYEH